MSDNTQTRRIGSDEQEDNKVHTQILSLSLSHTHTHTTSCCRKTLAVLHITRPPTLLSTFAHGDRLRLETRGFISLINEETIDGYSCDGSET